MSSKKIQPEYLKPGDEVAIISPSFFIDEEKVAGAVTVLNQWGLKVRVGRNALKRNGSFAGSDKERLCDLQEMTDDSEIKAVICSRGGYGISKIINNVDFSALKINPKWYVGFSDITVLQMWLNEVYGIISVHGEMPLNFSSHARNGEVLRSLQQALFGDLHPCIWEGHFLNSSNAVGEMTGGNLSLIYSLAGTPAEPETKGKILFIEEVGEYYYHIDRMLTSLKLAGKLEGLSALVIGGMNDIKDAKLPWSKSIEKTIYSVVGEYGYPLFFNFPAGHIADNRAFYIGKQAKIEIKGKKATLTYI
ncbi:MAG TPA: LD-carboxypeptidase [Bacteroidales bacterium]|nr:LD-carboxypeptidase [Bacteroidales bacterium]